MRFVAACIPIVPDIHQVVQKTVKNALKDENVHH